MTRWPYPRSIMIMMMVAVRAFDEDSERPAQWAAGSPPRAEPVAKELPTRTVGSLNWRLLECTLSGRSHWHFSPGAHEFFIEVGL
jgi:hypothetical protein